MNFLDTVPHQCGTFRLCRERELKRIKNLSIIFIERKYVIFQKKNKIIEKRRSVKKNEQTYKYDDKFDTFRKDSANFYYFIILKLSIVLDFIISRIIAQ